MADLSWRFDTREYEYVKEVLDSGFASGTSGSMNSRLEQAFAARYGLKYGITFNSGTTTLHTALWALGIECGDEVLVPALTVISCMNAVVYCNAIPVFVDVDPETFTIDPEDVRKKLTRRTKAIMPVHLYGQVADMTKIIAIAREYSLSVVEDCVQCYLGSHGGRLGGTFGEVGSWSFENSKHLTTGDGGIILCDDEGLATRIRKLSCQGFRNATAGSGKIRVDKDVFQSPLYKRHDLLGFMYRLPEVAAAIGLAQLEKLDRFVEKRQRMAQLYLEALAGCDWLRPQRVGDGDRHSYYTFAAALMRDDIDWFDFRKRYIANGGDGIYAAWALLYQEDSIPDIRRYLKTLGLEQRLTAEPGICPNAESLQPRLMQFTTNQKDEVEMSVQARALERTVREFA